MSSQKTKDNIVDLNEEFDFLAKDVMGDDDESSDDEYDFRKKRGGRKQCLISKEMERKIKRILSTRSLTFEKDPKDFRPIVKLWVQREQRFYWKSKLQ